MGILKTFEANRFHVILWIIWQFALIIGNQALFPIYLNFKPFWRCVRFAAANVTTLTSPGAGAASTAAATEFGQNCSLVSLCEELEFDAPYSSAVEEFGMLCGEAEYHSSLITTMFFIGNVPASLIFGHISDHFGRKKLSIGGYVVFAVLSVICGFSTNWVMLLVLRVCLGFMSGGLLLSHYSFTYEFIPPKQRLFVEGIFNWGMARMWFNLICYFTGYWRATSIVMGIVALVPAIGIAVFVPESIRWSRTKGRMTEAKCSIEWIAKISGKKKGNLNVGERGSFIGEDEMYTSIGDLAMSQTLDGKARKVVTMKDLFSSRYITKITLVLWVMWFTAALCSYTNDLNSGTLAGSFYLNQFFFGALTAASKFLVFLLDMFVPRFSRRVLHQSGQLTVALFNVAFIVFILCSTPENKDVIGSAMTALSIIAIFGIDFIWVGCLVCSVESFPTEIRAIGTGSAAFWSCFGGIIAPQMLYLRSVWSPFPFAVVAVTGFLCFLISFFFLPDTKGQELKDTLSEGGSAAKKRMQSKKKSKNGSLLTISNTKDPLLEPVFQEPPTATEQFPTKDPL